MADFGNLSNYYIAKQRLIKYNSGDRTSNDLDVNKDGKIDEKDLTDIANAIRKAQTKEGNIFDFNNDRKINKDDWDFFQNYLNGYDIDGDGTISDEEKQFLQQQKSLLKNAVIEQLKKDGFTGEFDGVQFKNGVRLQGSKTELAFDMNKDGKVDEADWDLIDTNKDGKINSAEASAVKDKRGANLDIDVTKADFFKFADFDVNKDGKIDEKDWKSLDTNKDGKIDNDEAASIKEQYGLEINKDVTKDNFLKYAQTTEIVYKDGTPCTGILNGRLYKNGLLDTAAKTVDGKLFINGLLFSGTHEEKLYSNGVLFSGLKNNNYYENGVLASGEYGGKLYINGVLTTSETWYPAKGTEGAKLYKDGRLFTGLHTEDGTTKFYAEGAVYSGDVRTNYSLQDGSAVSVIYKYGEDGKLANGLVGDLMYANGLLFTGTKDGKTYKFGVEVPSISADTMAALSDGTKSNEVKDANGKVTSFVKTVGSGSNAVVYNVSISYNGNTATRTETNTQTGETTIYTLNCSGATPKIKDSKTINASGTEFFRTYDDNGTCNNIDVIKVNGIEYAQEADGTVTCTVLRETSSDGTIKETYMYPNGNVVVKNKNKNGDVNYALAVNKDGSRTEVVNKDGKEYTYQVSADGKTLTSIVKQGSNIISKRIENETTITYYNGEHTLVYNKAGQFAKLDGEPVGRNTNEVKADIEELKGEIFEELTNLIQSSIYKDISQQLLDAVNSAVEAYMNEQTDNLTNKIGLIMSENSDLSYAATLLMKKYTSSSTFRETMLALEDKLNGYFNDLHGRNIDGFNFEAQSITKTQPGYNAVDYISSKASAKEAEKSEYDAKLSTIQAYAASISEKSDGIITSINTYVDGLTNKAHYIEVNNEWIKIDENAFANTYKVVDADGNEITTGTLAEKLATTGAKVVTNEFYSYWQSVKGDNGKYTVTIDGATLTLTETEFNSGYKVVDVNGNEITTGTLAEKLATAGAKVVTNEFFASMSSMYYDGTTRITIESLRSHDYYIVNSSTGAVVTAGINESTLLNKLASLANEGNILITRNLYEAWTSRTNTDTSFADFKTAYANDNYGDTGVVTPRINKAQALKDCPTTISASKNNTNFAQAISSWNSDEAHTTSATVEVKEEYNTEDDAIVTAAYTSAVNEAFNQINEQLIPFMEGAMKEVLSLRTSLLAAGYSESSLNNSAQYRAAINIASSALTKLLNALKSGADKLTNEAKTDLETYVKTVEGKLSSVNALTSSLSQSTDKTYKAVTSSEIVSSIYYGLNHYDKLMAFREVTDINGNTVYYLKETISENVYNNLSPLVKNLFKANQVTTQTEDDD